MSVNTCILPKQRDEPSWCCACFRALTHSRINSGTDEKPGNTFKDTMLQAYLRASDIEMCSGIHPVRGDVLISVLTNSAQQYKPYVNDHNKI